MSSAFCCRAVSEGPDIRNRSFSWRNLISWSMIDFSNSLVIMIVNLVYPSFMQQFMYTSIVDGRKSFSSANITNIVLALFFSPILGVLSDFYYLRLPILGISTLVYGVLTCLLYLVKDASWRNFALTMFFFIIFSFRFNEAVAGAFLPSLCNDRDMGFASGLGFCIGFISGTIVLAIVNMMTPARIIGMEGNIPIYDVPQTYKDRAVSMLVTGIIMLLSVIPPILMLDNGIPEGEKRPPVRCAVFGEAFVTLGRTLKSGVRVNLAITLLLVSVLFFWWGASHVASFSGQLFAVHLTGYGWTIHLMTEWLAYYNIIVAATSVLYGLIARKTGSKPLILFSSFAMLTSMVFPMAWKEMGRSMNLPEDKWAKVFVMGVSTVPALGQGPYQSLVRGAILVLTPPEKKCEVMGFLETIQLIAWLLGNITGTATVGKGLRPYYLVPTITHAITFIIAAISPLGKMEKAKRKELAKYGNMTIDKSAVLRRAEQGANVAEVIAAASVDGDEPAHGSAAVHSDAGPQSSPTPGVSTE